MSHITKHILQSKESNSGILKIQHSHFQAMWVRTVKYLKISTPKSSYPLCYWFGHIAISLQGYSLISRDAYLCIFTHTSQPVICSNLDGQPVKHCWGTAVLLHYVTQGAVLLALCLLALNFLAVVKAEGSLQLNFRWNKEIQTKNVLCTVLRSCEYFHYPHNGKGLVKIHLALVMCNASGHVWINCVSPIRVNEDIANTVNGI